MTDVGAVLGIDVGGTGIKARLVDADDRVLAEHRVPTPTDDPEARALAEVVAGLVAASTADAADHGTRVDAVGLVVPGVVDDAAGRVAFAVNLGWRDVPVRDRVAEAIAGGADARAALPIAFGQDVRAGALAEVHALAALGAGPDGTTVVTGTDGTGTVAFVPVGTGLASALVVDGRVLSSHGWAGEIGQVRIPHGPLAGLRVEEVASAGAVARRAGAASAREVADRVRRGDPDARRVWDDCVEVLADALAWITAVTGCDTVVVGGGLAESGGLLLDPLDDALRERLAGLRPPVLTRARHGDGAGAIGAVLMARARAASVGAPA